MTAQDPAPRTDQLARWLVHSAARRAPPPFPERLEEEWLADLSARGGPMSRLRFGLGCCWAATVIYHEHCGTSVAAAGSSRGQRTMTYDSHGNLPFFTRRTLALLLIACLHVILIYALASGIVHTVIKAIPPPVQILRTPPKPLNPPRLPGPTLVRPGPIEAPASPPVIDQPFDPPGIVGVLPPPPESSPPGPAINRVVGGPGKGFPNTEEYYPPASRRARETGAAAIRVCVDVTGRLTAPPTIAQSSGSPALDEGARRLAQAGSGRYRPTTEDGRPVDSCYVFRVRFEMRD